MTDYKNIRGKKVKFFTSDLSNAQDEGQLFFQNTERDENRSMRLVLHGQVVQLFLLVDITVLVVQHLETQV